MAISMGNDSGRAGTPWRLVGWGGAALLLTLPYIANAPWTPADYVFMAVLFGLVGGAFEIINRASRSLAYRLGAAAAVQAVLSAIGWFDDPRGGLLSMVFVVPWLVSAALFRAARDQGVAK